MVITKLMQRIFSAQENNEDLVLNQIHNDMALAVDGNPVHTEQLDYERNQDGSVKAVDKVNGEVTVFKKSPSGNITMYSESVPSTDITSHFKGDKKSPDSCEDPKVGIENKEKAGLKTFSSKVTLISREDCIKIFSDLGWEDLRLFAEEGKVSESKQDKAKEELPEKKEKEKEAKDKVAEARKNGVKGSKLTKLIAGATIASAAVAATAALASGDAMGAARAGMLALTGKRMKESAEMAEKQNKALDESSKSMSAAGLQDTQSIVLGKLVALKSTSDNLQRKNIIKDLAKISESIEDQKIKGILKPLIKEVAVIKPSDSQYTVIIDDMINALSSEGITKKFTEVKKEDITMGVDKDKLQEAKEKMDEAQRLYAEAYREKDKIKAEKAKSIASKIANATVLGALSTAAGLLVKKINDDLNKNWFQRLIS